MEAGASSCRIAGIGFPKQIESRGCLGRIDLSWDLFYTNAPMPLAHILYILNQWQ